MLYAGLLAGCGVSVSDALTLQVALTRDGGDVTARDGGGGTPPFDTCAGADSGTRGEGQVKFCDLPPISGWVPMQGASCTELFEQCHTIRAANPMASLSCTWNEAGRTRVLLDQSLTPGACAPYLRLWSLPVAPPEPPRPPTPCTGKSGLGEYRLKLCSHPPGEGLVYTPAISCDEALTNCRENQYENLNESMTCTWTQGGQTTVLHTYELEEGVCRPYLGAWPPPTAPAGR